MTDHHPNHKRRRRTTTGHQSMTGASTAARSSNALRGSEHSPSTATSFATGGPAVPPRDPQLATLLTTPGFAAADHVEILLQTACDHQLLTASGDAPDALELEMFHDTAHHASESMHADLILAHLLAVLCSTVDALAATEEMCEVTVVVSTVDASPHAVDPDMLMCLLELGLGFEAYRKEMSATREWIEAAAILATFCLIVSDADIDWGRPLVDEWTHYDPRWFLPEDSVARLDSAAGTVR